MLTCLDCGETLPITEFRRRERGSEKRQPQCRTCRNRHEREYRAARRRNDVEAFVRDTKQKRSAKAVRNLVIVMLKRYGGVQGFAAEWRRQINAAPAGSRMAMDSLFAMMNLMQMVDEDV